MTLDDFLTLTLPQRIAWLHGAEGPQGKMSHDRFAEELGVPNRQTIIGWENGREPSKPYAAKLDEFSGFPAWAFRRRESEEAAFESFARRLRELEDQQGDLRDLVLDAFALIRKLETQAAEESHAVPQSQPRRARGG